MLIQETTSGTSLIRHFLTDPELAALLANSKQLRGILRPLCHALGLRPIHVSSLYPPAPANQPPPKPPPGVDTSAVFLARAAPPDNPPAAFSRALT